VSVGTTGGSVGGETGSVTPPGAVVVGEVEIVQAKSMETRITRGKTIFFMVSPLLDIIIIRN